MVNCRGYPHTKQCGKVCQPINWNCRKAPDNKIKRCNPNISKRCGTTCISLNKQCRDMDRIKTILNNEDIVWKDKIANAERWMRDLEAQGRPPSFWNPPRNSCADAITNLTTDIITLDDKVPSCKDCQIAKAFCNPSRNHLYGGTDVQYNAIFDRCR